MINKNFYYISCSGGTTRTDLIGRAVQNVSNGSINFLPSPFLEAFENGGVCLVDELSASQSDMLMALNSGLANGYISVPERTKNPIALRHKDFILIATANTITGINNIYSGQNPLDGSILDRFKGCIIKVEYSLNYEKSLSLSFPKTANVLWKLREYCKEHDIQHIISTRVFEALFDYINNNKKHFQDRPKDILNYIGFFEDWSPEEKTMIEDILNNKNDD